MEVFRSPRVASSWSLTLLPLCQAVQRVPQSVLKVGADMQNPRHFLSPTPEHNSLGGGFTPSGTEGPRQERCSRVSQALTARSASTTLCRGTAASGRDSGLKGTVTHCGWNKVWTAVFGRAELDAKERR